ncbi:hypothetical protein DV738_g2334, partial [Chaetothyriales sp. CBS 135597]
MAAISSLVVHDMARHKPAADDLDTPTTPRAPKFPTSRPPDHGDRPSDVAQSHSRQNTPTPGDRLSNDETAGSSRPGTSGSIAVSDAMDVDTQKDSDGEDAVGDGDADAAARKKKGQRFFCTGYPPCNLSFTRSEHLARHIRKHTGERPFQCHCNRRFSRLDNLRQHAQTVHVNEEIPTDSLAATGTRFQRQIRTDKVRQGPRPRSGTLGSASSHIRGHSRNLSASSIGSTSSNYSTVTEAKRRPPPLLLANDSSRPKLGLEPPGTPPAQYHGAGQRSPGGPATPTSATWSAAPGSPGFGSSSLNSPISSAARLAGYGIRTPGRRLSVPSGPNPYHQQPPPPFPFPTHAMSMGPPSAASSALPSSYASPTASHFSLASSYRGPPGEDWRRRTWHPSTFTGAGYPYSRPATSGLTYSQTPDAPHPTFASHATAANGQAQRLPGIESFDQVQYRPSTPPRRQFSPAYPGSSHSQPAKSSPYAELDNTKSWRHQAIEENHRVGPTSAPDALHAHSLAQRTKRQGWYNVPPVGSRTSPEDSSSSDGISTPGASAVDVNPIILPSSGYIDPPHAIIAPDSQQNACLGPPAQTRSPYNERPPSEHTTSFGGRSSTNNGDMNRLDALVAVATSGEAAAAR